MAKITWDKIGERFYETGVDQGVLYPQDDNGEYPLGVAWNGLINVTESPSGAESNPLYADNIKYLDLISTEELGASIEAYTYPKEFEQCDGSAEIAKGVKINQQPRKAFGLVYRTVVGNDTKGNDHGYKLHLLYNAKAAPTERSYATINDSPEALSFSWEVTTTPIAVEGYKPTALLTIDSTEVPAEFIKKVEDILYGAETEEARLPLPDEIIQLFETTNAQG